MTPVLMLHGVNGWGAEMEPLAAPLRAYAEVRTMDLAGHGGRPLPERLSIPGLADDVIAWLDREKIERVILAGYSTGGYLALYLARHHPQRVQAVVALVTKYVWDREIISRAIHLADPERVKRNGGPRLEALKRNHGDPNWEAVTLANRRFFEDLGTNLPLNDADIAAIHTSVMAVCGDRDAIVPWSEQLALRRLLPDCHLAMFYGNGHPPTALPVLALARAIGPWIQSHR
jgi:pimeloyl-ACP methyl ester carboxylesterase